MRKSVIIACAAVGIGCVIGTALGIRSYYRTRQERLRHMWNVELTFEDGSSRTLKLDGRKSVEQLSESLSEAIRPMFSSLTRPSSGYRTLGTIHLEYCYSTTSDENETVRMVRDAAERSGKSISATFSIQIDLPEYKVLLTPTGECHLATEEEMKKGPEQHRVQMPDPSIADGFIARTIAEDIHLMHKSVPISLGEK